MQHTRKKDVSGNKLAGKKWQIKIAVRTLTGRQATDRHMAIVAYLGNSPNLQCPHAHLENQRHSPMLVESAGLKVSSR